MKNRKNINIALAFSGINPEYQDIIANAIVHKVKSKKYNLCIFAPFSSDADYTVFDCGEENIFELINFEVFDVLIIISDVMYNEQLTQILIQRAKKAGTAVIAIEGDHEDCNTIHIDNSYGIQNILDHLINVHGIKDYMYVSSFEGENADDRFIEFKKIITNFGIEIDDNMIIYGEYNEDKAALQIRKHINSGDRIPEAIICANDSMAIGVIKELKAHGYSVPSDVVVTGFDGIRFAHANNPSLTTAAMPYYELGEMAVNIIPEVLSLENSQVKKYIAKNKLVVSESCGCFEKDSSDDNNLISYLYQKLDRSSEFSIRLIRMSETLNSATTINEIYKMSKEFIEDIYVDRFYLCIAENFKSCIKNDGLMVSKKLQRPGYPEEMTMPICREYKKYLDGSTFNTADIIPALLQEQDYGQIFYFTPIHYQDITFGYICMSVDSYIGSSSLFNSWRMNLSAALENARIREELTAYSNELEKMYIEDSLTGLYNRRGLYNWASEIYTKAYDSQKRVMVFAADLDGLKPINDVFGHKEGDNALVQVAKALHKAAVNGEICSRFGGDEFEVIGYDYTEEAAEEFAVNFSNYLEEYNVNSQKPYKVSASWGYVVKLVDDNTMFDEFIMSADQNMYNQKALKKTNRA